MQNLESLQQKYSGKCFIIGSGPSLATQSLDFLSNHISIAVNSGCWKYSDADFFVSDDQDVFFIEYFYETLRKSNKTKVLLYERKFRDFGIWKECEELFGNRLYSFNHSDNYNLTHKYKHSSKKHGIWRARSSAGSAINIAHVLGCKEIILLGIDCCYVNGKRHFYELDGYTPPKRKKPPVQKRFIRKIGNQETDTDLMEILQYWNNLNKKINNHFKVYNASPISLIKCFEKIKL